MKSDEKYLARIIEQSLQEKLGLYGAVCVVGCKWCGKSTTAKRFAKSRLELQNPLSYQNAVATAETRPDLLLVGEKPRLIDEWQDLPVIWDTIRYAVDEDEAKGQYILTGSATPRETDQPRHTGTGRIPKLKMRPMSLYESRESTGEVRLADLFDNAEIAAASSLQLEDIAFMAVRGGWPASIGVEGKKAFRYAEDYIKAVTEEDIQRIDGVERNPMRMRLLLRSLARHTMTPASIATIAQDIFPDADGTDTVNRKTITDYINVLEKLYLVEDVPAWMPKLRSKTEIRSTAKRALVDPSLAVAALHATDEDLLKDFRTFGLVFELLCVRDLRVYAEAMGGEVLYYRDKSGLECDAVIHLPDARWAAVEVKLGGDKAVEEAAANLLKLKDLVDEDAMQPPAFLMVLTATGYAYQRKDGVYVVPIGLLG